MLLKINATKKARQQKKKSPPIQIIQSCNDYSRSLQQERSRAHAVQRKTRRRHRAPTRKYGHRATPVDEYVGPVHRLRHVICVGGHDERLARGSPHGNVDAADEVVRPDGRCVEEEGCDTGEGERKGGRITFDIHRRGV